MDYKKMSEVELRGILNEYINRCSDLMDLIGEYLQGKANLQMSNLIHDTYATLKSEIKEIAHYCDKISNKNYNNKFYSAYFKPSFFEASAWGFTAKINSVINQRLYSSVEEAHYKLGKYIH